MASNGSSRQRLKSALKGTADALIAAAEHPKLAPDYAEKLGNYVSEATAAARSISRAQSRKVLASELSKQKEKELGRMDRKLRKKHVDHKRRDSAMENFETMISFLKQT